MKPMTALDLFRLDDKVALVTGSGRGIGRGIALTMAECGADVIIVDYAKDRMEQTSSDVKALGRKSIGIEANVRSAELVNEMFEKAMKETGDLEFWMAHEQAGNEVYASSNSIMLIVLCNRMREIGFTGTEEDLIGHLQRLPIHISHEINKFCKGYFIEILLKDKSFEERKTVTVMAPLLSTVHLPLIVYNDLGRKKSVK